MTLEIILHTLEGDGLGLKKEKGATFAARQIILWLKRFQISDDGQSRFLGLIQIIVLLLQSFDLERCIFIVHMSRADDPIVKKATSAEIKKGDFTKITFKPDLDRFNMDTLDKYAVGLLSRRAYDIAGTMSGKGGKKLSVFLNGKKLPVKDFKSYLALFDDLDAPQAFERINDDWEVGVGVNTEGSVSLST